MDTVATFILHFHFALMTTRALCGARCDRSPGHSFFPDAPKRDLLANRKVSVAELRDVSRRN